MVDDLEDICKLLSETQTIAVVGFSRDKTKTSREIADYLVDRGYHVVGINPFYKEENSDGIKVYSSLADVPFDIDIVDVFRRSEDIPGIIGDVLKKKPKVLWLQQGIRNDAAVKPVIDDGIIVIQDKCIAVYNSLCKPFLHN